MGDRLKNWLQSKIVGDAQDSDDPPTLSEVLTVNKYLSEEEVDAFCDYANTLRGKEELT